MSYLDILVQFVPADKFDGIIGVMYDAPHYQLSITKQNDIFIQIMIKFIVSKNCGTWSEIQPWTCTT